MTGVFLGALGMDIHLTETYFIVAHFHFVMVGGMLMAFLAGVHFWWPKMTGPDVPRSALSKLADGDELHRLQPDVPAAKFILGYLGMPRRYAALPTWVPGAERAFDGGCYGAGRGLPDCR